MNHGITIYNAWDSTVRRNVPVLNFYQRIAKYVLLFNVD